MNTKYNPETYWSEVGSRIEARNNSSVIAGDDEPFYVYKRKEFLKLFHTINFLNKRVLEVGSGPGGNLLEVIKKKPKKLFGVDISNQMIHLAQSVLPKSIEISKTNGTTLPYEDNSFDIIYTVTVLQHNTDENMLCSLMSEIGRVSSDKVYIFERIEKEIKGTNLCMGRPVSYYENIMKSAGFELVSTQFSNINCSYYVCGAIRKIFESKNKTEGQPPSTMTKFLQYITLPFTKILDKVFKRNRDLAKLEFVKSKEE